MYSRNLWKNRLIILSQKFRDCFLGEKELITQYWQDSLCFIIRISKFTLSYFAFAKSFLSCLLSVSKTRRDNKQQTFGCTLLCGFHLGMLTKLSEQLWAADADVFTNAEYQRLSLGNFLGKKKTPKCWLCKKMGKFRITLIPGSDCETVVGKGLEKCRVFVTDPCGCLENTLSEPLSSTL